jgi:hypothetical protein
VRPPGARAFGPALVGGLLESLGHAGPGLAAVVGAVRAWRLIALFVEKHARPGR